MYLYLYTWFLEYKYVHIYMYLFLYMYIYVRIYIYIYSDTLRRNIYEYTYIFDTSKASDSVDATLMQGTVLDSCQTTITSIQ